MKTIQAFLAIALVISSSCAAFADEGYCTIHAYSKKYLLGVIPYESEVATVTYKKGNDWDGIGWDCSGLGYLTHHKGIDLVKTTGYDANTHKHYFGKADYNGSYRDRDTGQWLPMASAGVSEFYVLLDPSEAQDSRSAKLVEPAPDHPAATPSEQARAALATAVL